MKPSTIPAAIIPQVLLPKNGINLKKWAVIACDQYTSQPDYWHRVREFVGESPSTYHMILPEVYLGTDEEKPHVQGINASMDQALKDQLLVPEEGLIYIERSLGQKVRRGLMLALDLEAYDFRQGSQTLIRASEGTILERIPPRVRIRENSPLEIPHIIVLIDDPDQTVIEPLGADKNKLTRLYDFDLMMNGGHLAGYRVEDPASVNAVVQGLAALASPQKFQEKYGLGADKQPLLFAIGDGNHSLATAKTIWEAIKATVGPDHPARYALVEVENIYDESLEFHPIHRILFGLKQDPIAALQEFFHQQVAFIPCQDQAEMIARVEHSVSPYQLVGTVSPQGVGIAEIRQPLSHLPVGTLQAFLDDFMRQKGAERLDYVHGEDVIFSLGQQAGNCAFYLPTIQKQDLFKTILINGVLPRKAFSMGEAWQKRFYMESRKIL